MVVAVFALSCCCFWWLYQAWNISWFPLSVQIEAGDSENSKFQGWMDIKGTIHEVLSLYSTSSCKQIWSFLLTIPTAKRMKILPSKCLVKAPDQILATQLAHFMVTALASTLRVRRLRDGSRATTLLRKSQRDCQCGSPGLKTALPSNSCGAVLCVPAEGLLPRLYSGLSHQSHSLLAPWVPPRRS